MSEEERQFTITAFAENSPGVLHRLTSTLTRRKINIESLTVSETVETGISRFTIVVNTCLLYTSPSPRDRTRSRMPSSA